MRLTVRRMMVAVAMISLNIAALPWLMEALQRFGLYTIGVAEMTAILMIPLPGLALRLATSGKIGGFPLGFEVFGWAGVSAYLACLVFAPESFSAYSEWVYRPLWRAIGPSHAQESIEATDRVSNLLMGMTDLFVYTAPSAVLASLGGWLFHRLGVEVIVRRRDPEGRRTKTLD
jgi:hypothetical protein